MGEDRSRRYFLRLLGATPGALALGGLASGCGPEPSHRRADPDATGSDPDAATGADGGPGRDAGAPDSGSRDAGSHDGGAPDAGPESCEVTGSDVEGPFHVEDAPQRRVLAESGEPGTRILIEGRVLDDECAPIAGALLDVWHADAEGDYHDAGAEYRLRGQMMTDAEGRYSFESIRPGNYPLGGSQRPAHIHFMVSKPGYEPLTTQLYFSDDPHLAPDDPCGVCNSGDATLIIDLLEASQPDIERTGTFDIVLVPTPD